MFIPFWIIAALIIFVPGSLTLIYKRGYQDRVDEECKKEFDKAFKK